MQSFKVAGKLFEVVTIEQENQIVIAIDESGIEFSFPLENIDCWID
jgi:hypothetical protein